MRVRCTGWSGGGAGACAVPTGDVDVSVAMGSLRCRSAPRGWHAVAAALLLLQCAALVGAQTSGRVLWSGALTHDGAELRVETTAVNQAVLLSARADLTEPILAVPVAEPGVAAVTVTDLQPGTVYYYGASGVDDGAPGRFRTASAPEGTPQSYRVAFASCAFTGAESPVFGEISSHDPLFFIHMGDLHYLDIDSDSMEERDASFHSVFASETQAAWFRSMPFVYMWDDHDFGPNNADGTFIGSEVARRAFQKYVPHYPLVEGEGNVPVYQAFTIGRVRYLVTDLRSMSKLPESVNSTLGYEQRRWLLDELAHYQDYSLVVWVSSKPWMGEPDEGSDKWAGYAEERTYIANQIVAIGVDNLVMLSGDAHVAAIDNGDHTDFSDVGGAGFPYFHAAPLAQYGSVKDTGPFSEGCFGYRFFNTGQYGIMDVEDDGEGDVCVRWVAYRQGSPDEPLTSYRFCGSTVREGTDDDTQGICTMPFFPPWAYVCMVIVILVALCVPACFIWRAVARRRALEGLPVSAKKGDLAAQERIGLSRSGAGAGHYESDPVPFDVPGMAARRTRGARAASGGADGSRLAAAAASGNSRARVRGPAGAATAGGWQ